MPQFILKANPKVDFYVCWSTVFDQPVAWGTREELTKLMEEEHPGSAGPDRFRRANANGTSMRDGDWFGYDQKIFSVRGTKAWDLQRSDLQAFCEALEADGEDDVYDFELPSVQKFLKEKVH